MHEPTIKTLPPIKLVGFGGTFTPETRHGIPALWEKLVPALGAIPNMANGTTFGYCQQADDEGAFNYMACAEVSSLSDVPAGMVAAEVPEQKYAVFAHALGSANIHEDIQPTVQYIWGEWAAQNKLADAPDLERYGPDFHPAPGQVIEFLVPVA